MKTRFFSLVIAAFAILIGSLTLARAQSAPTVSAQQTALPASVGASIKIPILVYHSVRPYYPGITDLVKEFTVPPDIFDDQLRYLRDNGFTAVTISDLDKALLYGAPLPPKPFLITLDDGWRNQYSYAFPVLKKYADPAVFYVYSGVIDKKVFLTWDELREMASSSMTIGGHTESHPELPKVPGTDSLIREISGSRKTIAARLSRDIADFAYPYGEYDNRVVQAVKDAGYTSARALGSCTAETKNDLFTLCGIIITGDFNRFVSLINK